MSFHEPAGLHGPAGSRFFEHYLSSVTHARFDSSYHAPVLVGEVLDVLGTARRVLDGTLGGGGHALALLENGADVTGIDRDPDAVNTARERLAHWAHAGRFRPIQGDFADVDSIPELSGATFDGIVLDLGVSSHQFDDTTRGFSFREGVALDMSMAGSGQIARGGTAADLLNSSDERDLIRIFREYGDEPRAARLAHEIVRRRANRPFELSDDLVGAIRAVLGPRSGPSEFARLFQAVRIAVNDELATLSRALPALRDRLIPGGVFAVIAYHSGEDRIVKNAFRDWSLSCVCPPRLPVCSCRGRPLGVTVRRKAVIATNDEVARNPRARSARLRAWRSAHAGEPVAQPAAASHRA